MPETAEVDPAVPRESDPDILRLLRNRPA
jgi:hypothetical protein